MENIEILTSQKVKINYELADMKDRIISNILDYVILGFIILFLSISALSSLGLLGEWGVMGIIFSLIFLYFLLFETFTQQTIGKMIMGYKIVHVNGKELSFSDHLLRSVFRLFEISSTLGILAIIVVILSDKKQRFGDIASNTVMIKTRGTSIFNVSDISSIESIQNYQVTYPAVSQFSEEEMLLLKRTISRVVKHNNSAHQNAVTQLTKKVCNQLSIEFPQPLHLQINLLKLILRDYIVVTR